jgi:thiamine pyrophosphokinase
MVISRGTSWWSGEVDGPDGRVRGDGGAAVEAAPYRRAATKGRGCAVIARVLVSMAGGSGCHAGGVALVVVFTGGDRVDAADVADLEPWRDTALVIAADRGADHAHSVGWSVDEVVGDLDSISADVLAAAVAAGVVVDEHPADKDETDLELALARAAAHLAVGEDVPGGAGASGPGPAPGGLAPVANRIVVVGGHGGRVDHLLANVAVLGSRRWGPVEIEARFGAARLWVVRSSVTVEGTPGDVVSLLPLTPVVAGVSTTGLRWALERADLRADEARGVSNELTEDVATIDVTSGTLLVVKPG